ncbi:hypothetical protein [Sphingobium sp. KCTC 72723]|uniref:hypothetical protein n=1 Tax=Sphingobium sp. KCTC 72723 TaxID=2733867 RepID=UPI00165E5284|nr:hypothetical protein [Sphingobium sp. KCTC 72723]
MAAPDHIEALALSYERDLAALLSRVHSAAFDEINADLIAAILDDIDADHIRAQLVMTLDLADDNLLPTIAEGNADLLFMLVGLVAAAAAHATAQVGHSINPRDAGLTPPNVAAQRLLARFNADSALAFAAAIETAIYGPGKPYSRALQLRRSIGLTVKQAAMLETMRMTLHQYLAAPQKVIPARVGPNGVRVPIMVVRNIDTRRLLAATRGHVSAAQRQMLKKALNNPKLTMAQAETILDDHAKELRAYRARAVAGEVIHTLIETAKLAGWRIAQRAGALAADQRRYWKTAGDERVRHTHAQVPAMNPKGVPLDQPFVTPLGDHFTPPLEYGCRCKAVLAKS